MAVSLIGLLFLLIGVSQAYTLIPGGSYEGNSFFDGWNFYGAGDNLTNGNVIFADMATAFNTANPLVEINNAQNAIFRVDNRSTVVSGLPRNSVRLDSKSKYGVGTLIVIDVVHMPFGCSVWPAFFTRGDDWPNNGEIDILEGWNKRTQNLMSLHTTGANDTTSGCAIPQNVTQQGTLQNSDCNQGNATIGCGVLASDTTTFGQGFNDAQGGVYATQFDINGIFIWFFSRNKIPDSLKRTSTSGTVDDIASWGMPTASFPASGSCNITEKFGPQTLSLVITLCGDAAGAVGEYNQTCANQAPNTPNPPPPGGGPDGSLCYPNNVVGPGSPRYDDAYFEVSHLRVYTASASTATNGPSNGGSSSGSNSGGTAGGSQTGSNSSGAPGASQTGGSSNALGVQAFPFMLSLLISSFGILLGQLFV